MIKDGTRPILAENGLLTPQNCVIALIDHQPQILLGASNADQQSIIDHTVMLAKTSRIFDVPTVLTTVEISGIGGCLWPKLKAVMPRHEIIQRSSINSWDDENFVSAIKKTGRRKIVMAGLWMETSVALPAIQAIHDGYEVYVVEDCCGDLNQLAHDNAMQRMIQAGAKPVAALSFLLELQRDWANHDTRNAVIDLIKSHLASTRLRGAPHNKYGQHAVHGNEPVHGLRLEPVHPFGDPL